MAIRAASRSGASLDMHVRRQETVDIASIHDKQGGGREFGDSPHRPAQPTGPGLTFATAAPEEDDGTYGPVPPYRLDRI